MLSNLTTLEGNHLRPILVLVINITTSLLLPFMYRPGEQGVALQHMITEGLEAEDPTTIDRVMVAIRRMVPLLDIMTNVEDMIITAILRRCRDHLRILQVNGMTVLILNT